MQSTRMFFLAYLSFFSISLRVAAVPFSRAAFGRSSSAHGCTKEMSNSTSLPESGSTTICQVCCYKVFWFSLVNNMQLAEALRPCLNYCVMSPDRPSAILTCDEVVPIPLKWPPAGTFDHLFGNLSVCMYVCLSVQHFRRSD